MVFQPARPLRAITNDPDFGSEPLLLGCNAALVKMVAGGDVHAPNYYCECAGAAFAARFDFPGRRAKEGTKGSSSASEDGESCEGEDYGRGKGAKEKAAGSFKLSEILKGVNLYDLIGISEGASQDEIKKAYRSLVLTEHPDKKAVADPVKAKQIQERFVQIQEAYELLSDTTKRMQYDSSLEFDDSLPKFKPELGDDFFEVFGEAFRRNARFSSKRPVPDIGGPDSKPEEWKRFYNFWHEFQSWRDPLVLAQKDGEELCDLNEAECREEKRWMMRENARVSKAYKQAERDRITDLVRLAEKFDPRVQAEKDAKKAARAAEMARRAEEKMAVQRAKEEADRKRQEAEEAARKAEAEKKAREKAAREVVKERIKKCRQRLRSFHPQVKHLVLIDQLNEVCLGFEEDALRKLGDDVEAALKNEDAAGAAGHMHAAIESLGLTPVISVKVEEDTQSTSSGDPSEEVVLTEEQLQQQRVQAEKRRAAEEQSAREEAEKAKERARLAAEKAEQKKIREEQRMREAQALEAKRKQMEKKEQERARKAEEKKKLEEEQEVQKRAQQREEARQKALEQAERDRQAAVAKKEEQDAERVAQIFATDRLERLAKLDHLSEQDLETATEQACRNNVSLPAALRLLQASRASDGSEAMIDKAMALLCKAGFVWPLGLLPPAAIRLPNAVRNRVKKARQRLRDAALACMAKLTEAGGTDSDVTEWQRGIIDGSIELPVWSIEEKEAEDRAAREAQKPQAVADAQPQQVNAGKKGKKTKEPKGEEDLDELLAEFGVTTTAPSPAKKSGGGKKKK